MEVIQERIRQLKKEKKAVLLAHYYQNMEVQEVADFVGDSFALSKTAREVDAKVIVFCGVHFMAESAKILSPEKTVLLPVRDAGCPMADMMTAEDVQRLKDQYPQAGVLCYVNSSAEVKALSDVCCTSSNAVSIAKAMPQKQIIFVPDQNLGQYVAQQVPQKEIVLCEGYCIVHHRVTAEEVIQAKEAHPDAVFLAHPECTPQVLAQADMVGSTAQILNYVERSDKNVFIIGTEQGILENLRIKHPNKTFYLASPKLVCTNMKKTKLEDVLASLEKMQHDITLDEDTRLKAYNSLDRMLSSG